MRRRSLSIAAMFFCVFALLFCVPVLADEETESAGMTAVCAQVPEDWSSPCLWAWDDEGVGAFASWPGGTMEEMDGGWYYCYVPETMANVIVNANEGTVQTSEIAVEAGQTAWITVAEDLSAEVSYEAPDGLEVPAYVETFTVHAYVPLAWKTADLWAWSAPDGTNAFAAWPGEAMTEGEDGWFTAQCPAWVNSIIVSGNDAEVQTEDISIEPQELWITVYEDLTYELVYEDPTVPDVENITVHVQAPADWTEPCLWAWSAPDGTNAFSAWPGEPLTQGEDGWYTMEVPGWINSVIVNGNGGEVQTSDISVEPGRDIWLVVEGPENVTLSYEEGAEAAAGQETETAGETQAETEAPAETQAEASGQTDEDADETQSNTAVYVVIIAVVAVVIIGAAAAAKKKKKE